MLVAACVVFLRDFYVKSVLGIARKKIFERGVKFLERGVNFNCSRICSNHSLLLVPNLFGSALG